MQETKRKVTDRTVKEFDALPLTNGYRILPRLKEFCTVTKTYQVLSLNLYNHDKFVKSIALPLDKIPEFIKAMCSIKRQLQIVERLCGNCAFFHTADCSYAGSPILKSDKFAKYCEYFVPKALRSKVKETPKGFNLDKEHFDKWLRNRRKKGYTQFGNGKYLIK